MQLHSARIKCELQRHGGRKGVDIVGIARIPLSRIPVHDDAAIAAAAAALAQQLAVSHSSVSSSGILFAKQRC